MISGRRAALVLVLSGIAYFTAATLEADWISGKPTLLERIPEDIKQGSIPYENSCTGITDAQRLHAAKISAAAAVRIVESSLDSTVVLAELAEESDFLVWSVRMLLEDGSIYVVQVDAGNGRILAARALEPQIPGCAEQPGHHDVAAQPPDPGVERRWWQLWKKHP